MRNQINVIICLIIVITCSNSYSREYNCTIEPVLYSGITLNSGYYLYGSLGGSIAGGIKINGRHSIDLHLTLNRITSDIADAPEPIKCKACVFRRNGFAN